jgi:pyridoxine kinase
MRTLVWFGGGTEEMRIVESGELLVHPKRRFDAVAVRGS